MRAGRRRRPVLVATLVAAGTLLASGAVVGGVWATSGVDTWGEVDFTEPLAVPPLAESTVDADGRRVFDLSLQAGRHDFGSGITADTWGMNGTYLGPTLRASRGEEVLVNVANGLDQSTTLHWHGMELPGEADGGPHQMVEPGATWSPTWEVDQPAATLWYHPHPHGRTADHVRRGLTGVFIVDDDDARSGLPSQYGVDDVPLVIQDRSFRDGEMVAGRGALSPVGDLGDTVVVNGTVGPYLDVTTERVRLRLLNGSAARVYDLGFDDGRELWLVGTDGGLLPAPEPVESVVLSPGDRAEVVVEVSAGERTVLRSFPTSLGSGGLVDRLSGGGDRLDVLELRAAERLAASPPLPDVLAPAPALADDAPSSVTRTFRLANDQINGRSMSMSRIDEVVPRGEVETWEVTNADGGPHNLHVHGVQLQVLGGASGGHEVAVPVEMRGWQDTVLLRPGESYRLAVRFAHAADEHAPYMVHCHLLRHEDAGMMAQVAVVEPGAEGVVPGSGGAAEERSEGGGHGGH